MKEKVWIILLSLFALGCSSGPEVIRYGEDQCTFCKMTIVDTKFGGEIVTSKGRAYKFDAIECLVSALPQYEDVSSIFVTPFDRPGTLTPVDSVFFLKSDRIHSPMGAGLAAFLDRKKGEPYRQEGNWLTWEGVKSKVR